MGASERKMIWAGHFQIFKENPIFGAGYGQNTKALPRVYLEMGAPPDTLVSHAHNQYLHLAAGTGILGLLSYLLIWFFFLKLNLTTTQMPTRKSLIHIFMGIKLHKNT
jgi:O-antigen ligase